MIMCIFIYKYLLHVFVGNNIQYNIYKSEIVDSRIFLSVGSSLFVPITGLEPRIIVRLCFVLGLMKPLYLLRSRLRSLFVLLGPRRTLWSFILSQVSLVLTPLNGFPMSSVKFLEGYWFRYI